MPRIFGHYVASPLLIRIVLEVAIVFGSVFLGLALPLIGFPLVRPAWGDAALAASVLTVLALGTSHVAGLYDTRATYARRELLLRLTLAYGAAYATMAALGFIVPPLLLTRKAFLLSSLTALPACAALRLVHDRMTASRRRLRQVLVLGSGRTSRLIREEIDATRAGYDVLGYLGQNGHAIGDDDVKCLGAIDDLEWVARVTRPDVIVVALEERRGQLPVSAIVECKLRGVEVDDWPTFYEKLTGKIPVGDLRPSWLVFADGFRPARPTVVAKRVIDVVASAIGLSLSLPALVAIAIAIRLDSAGPALFRQARIGQSGRTFSVFKFRSMRADAHLIPPPLPGHPDPRVTRVGALLRRTRLDELPQLINVLIGDMSLVGPRPEWIALVPEFREKVPAYLYRLTAKPGITGWAQVNNPYGATVENTYEKLQYDLYYIKNMSIFLDLLILLHTIQIVLFSGGSGEWKSPERRESPTTVSCAG